MRELSPAGQQAVNDIAVRHGFGADAVAHMLGALTDTHGGMAQFNHPEFGGYGQWMRGGMTMVSDMFNNHLKSRVDGLCADLAGLLARQPDLYRAAGGFAAPGGGGNWWPGELGWPNSSGAQNNSRYAYFAQSRRLAVELNGHVSVYDTLDHQIGGFSQQQSSGGTMMFTSQYGLVDVATLPVIFGERLTSAAAPPPPMPQPSAEYARNPAPAADGDVFAAIEKLAGLRARGFLTDDEFNTKKAELLSRI